VIHVNAEPLTAPPGTTERAIEVPWVLRQYRGERRVLDVGYAFAPQNYIDALTSLGIPRLVGVDLNGHRDPPPPNMETLIADVRALPLETCSFDLVICISTLEHIGRDNTVYGVHTERDEAGISAALTEMGRVLTRHGRLLVTVPTGDREDRTDFLQATPDEWCAIFRAACFDCDYIVYELTENGWRHTPSFDPVGVGYGSRGPAASAVLCAELVLTPPS